MPSRVSLPEPILIRKPSQMRSLCEKCRSDGIFAFDTEFVMEDRFEAEICLVQVATRAGVSVVDPFAPVDLLPLWELVADAGVQTVVHAGQEDLAFCVRHTGRPPRRVFDVQVAAGLVGYDYPLSLQKLVQATQHVRLRKTKTLTDWRQRPLTPEQLRYAVEDVAYLLAIHDRLDASLRKKHRREWAREEFQRFEDIGVYERTEEDALGRVKGSGSLRGQNLVILRHLLAWRESLAQRVNRPARVVFRDHLLVEVAKHRIQEERELRGLRGMNLNRRDAQLLCQAVKKALAVPESEWPARRKHRDEDLPDQASLTALATAVIRSYCLENDLAYGLVATQRTIRQLVRHCTRPGEAPGDEEPVELLQGWRGRALGAMVKAVLLGKRTLRVESDHQQHWRIHVQPNKS